MYYIRGKTTHSSRYTIQYKYLDDDSLLFCMLALLYYKMYKKYYTYVGQKKKRKNRIINKVRKDKMCVSNFSKTRKITSSKIYLRQIDNNKQLWSIITPENILINLKYFICNIHTE